MLSLLHLRVKAQKYFVSLSYIFLDKKNVPKIWLNLGLDLTIFQGTGPTAGLELGASRLQAWYSNCLTMLPP